MTKTSLDGQVAIVTGAARGIGLAIAKLMAERGAKVVVWDRDLAPLKDTDFKPAMAEAVDVADYGRSSAPSTPRWRNSARSTSSSTMPASTGRSRRPGNTRSKIGTASWQST